MILQRGSRRRDLTKENVEQFLKVAGDEFLLMKVIHLKLHLKTKFNVFSFVSSCIDNWNKRRMPKRRIDVHIKVRDTFITVKFLTPRTMLLGISRLRLGRSEVSISLILSTDILLCDRRTPSMTASL